MKTITIRTDFTVLVPKNMTDEQVRALSIEVHAPNLTVLGAALRPIREAKLVELTTINVLDENGEEI